jgi:hypothetical protein
MHWFLSIGFTVAFMSRSDAGVKGKTISSNSVNANVWKLHVHIYDLTNVASGKLGDVFIALNKET